MASLYLALTPTLNFILTLTLTLTLNPALTFMPIGEECGGPPQGPPTVAWWRWWRRRWRWKGE